MNYLTSGEVQKKYNISRTTLFRLEKKGLPFIGIGRSKRYEESEVDQWLININNGIKGLIIGYIYDNTTIASVFSCGTQGGMRRSHTTNTLVIFSDHTRGVYDDRWIDDSTLLYTGMGQEGDQVLDGNQNRTMYESRKNGINIHLFETFKPGEHMYRGQVELIDDPYIDYQEDVKGNNRKVWIFPIKLKTSTSVPFELIESVNDLREKEANKMTLEKLKKRAKITNKVGTRSVVTKTHVRDAFISKYVKKRASGICDLCEEKAPFLDKSGEPYLESHHVDWLSEGGEDSITNCVALCPSCHRKVHVLSLKEDKEKLKNKLKFYEVQDNY
ncbi:MAG: HNH endonuclease [Paraclostridium dentum]|uniref:HNH endonuclease n=1 Tax=Paraclostridium dentum TaxID=2662455 RepID=UPI003EE429FC